MRKILVGVAAAGLVAVGCGKKGTTSSAGSTASAAPAAKKAGGKIESRSGSKVTGDVLFVQGADGKVAVTVHVAGAAPGDHGVHLHEKGDCSAPDAASAGGHFNPAGQAHGAPTSAHHHAGDFGNIHVGADGTGTLTLTSSDLSVAPGPNSVVGHGLIVHEKADDMMTQPTGNAGGRQGCAVISAMGS